MCSGSRRHNLRAAWTCRSMGVCTSDGRDFWEFFFTIICSVCLFAPCCGNLLLTICESQWSYRFNPWSPWGAQSYTLWQSLTGMPEGPRKGAKEISMHLTLTLPVQVSSNACHRCSNNKLQWPLCWTCLADEDKTRCYFVSDSFPSPTLVVRRISTSCPQMCGQAANLPYHPLPLDSALTMETMAMKLQCKVLQWRFL